MRGLISTVLLLAMVGCAERPTMEAWEPVDPVEAAHAYINDARVRRLALEESLAVTDNEYAQERLGHYALSGASIDAPDMDWDYNPVRVARRVRRLRVAATDEGPAPEPFVSETVIPEGGLERVGDYVEAGRLGFELCPIHIDPRFSELRRGAETARDHGLHVAADGEVAGAVEVQTDDGGWAVALTCAACHSSARDGRLIAGLPNSELRLAELMGAPIWLPGTMDVTADGIHNPVRPSDLRPLRLQRRLHHAGNIHNGRIATMVRIETLIAGRSSFEERPDRTLVAAMALYLESLADQLDTPDPAHPGAAVFNRSCGRCHQGPDMSGPPVDQHIVGTDAAATVGSARGTGAYRTPSLRGAVDRRSILHDGSAADLRALLGLSPSAHQGHPFGTELTPESQKAIFDFLSSSGR